MKDTLARMISSMLIMSVAQHTDLRGGSDIRGEVAVLGLTPFTGMVAFTTVSSQSLVEVLICIVPTPGQAFDPSECLILLLSSWVRIDLVQL